MIVRNVRDIKAYDKCKDLELINRLDGVLSEEFTSNLREFLDIRSNFRIKPNTEFKLIKVLLRTDVLYETLVDLEKLLTLLRYDNSDDIEINRFRGTLIEHGLDMCYMYDDTMFAISEGVFNKREHSRQRLSLLVNRYNKLKSIDSEEVLGLSKLNVEFSRKFKIEIYNCLVGLGTLENTGLRHGEGNYDFEELLDMANKEKFEKVSIESDEKFDALYHVSACLVFNVVKLNKFPISWEDTKGKLLEIYLDLILRNMKTYNRIYKSSKLEQNK